MPQQRGFPPIRQKDFLPAPLENNSIHRGPEEIQTFRISEEISGRGILILPLVRDGKPQPREMRQLLIRYSFMGKRISLTSPIRKDYKPPRDSAKLLKAISMAHLLTNGMHGT